MSKSLGEAEKQAHAEVKELNENSALISKALANISRLSEEGK